MIPQIALASAAVVLASVATAGIFYWARHRQVLAFPNERSSHTIATPLGGGLAIVGLTLTLWLTYLAWSARFQPTLLAYVGGAMLVATVGWIDDIYGLRRLIRFLVHSLAALIVISAFGFFDEVRLPLFGLVHLGLLGAPLLFLWIVGLTNAYNFMDGIDGIAGGQALVAGLGGLALFSLIHQPVAASLGLLAAATSLGFLIHNWPPARIFMGDVGSYFLGYTFAVTPMMVEPENPNIPVVALLIVWPFVFDTCFTLLIRVKNRENIFDAHRSHLYQRLIVAGKSHFSVTLLYVVLGEIGVLLAWLWLSFTDVREIAIPVMLLLGYWLWRYTVRVEHVRRAQEKDLKFVLPARPRAPKRVDADRETGAAGLTRATDERAETPAAEPALSREEMSRFERFRTLAGIPGFWAPGGVSRFAKRDKEANTVAGSGSRQSGRGPE